MNRSTTAACALALTTFAVTGSACGLTQSNDPAKASKGTGTINVESSGGACDLTAKKAPSGNVVFKVKNTGNEVTEFYLYGSDGLRIVGEIENIGPGLTRDLVVRAQPGKYVTACKPGMKGQGIRSAFQVTDSGKDTAIKGVDQADIDAATTQYAAYVKDQSQELVDATTAFVKAYESGDDAKARALFPLARGHYERIEPVAESFGDLDPELDLREADLEKGQEWTGWHRIEKDLWPPAKGYATLDAAGRKKYADNLLANTQDLQKRVQTLKFTVDQIGNGSKGLLDEVASQQDHRRGGHLVAHRPLGLPGQRRRRPGRLRGPQADPRGQGPRALAADPGRLRQAAAAARPVQDGQRLRLLRQGHPGAAQAALRRGERPGRAALQDDRSHHPVTDPHGQHHPPDDTGQGAFSRRRLLGVAGAGALAAGAAGVGGYAWGSSDDDTVRRRLGQRPAYAFHGRHQAGITTPAQDRLHFASFDVTTTVARRPDRPAARSGPSPRAR